MAAIILKNIKKIYQGATDNQIQGASILIKDGLIQTIAPFKKIQEQNPAISDQAEIVDCSDIILLPGFVDSHTHLLFAGTRENELYMRAQGRSYLDILEQGGGIYYTVQKVRNASEEELLQNGLRYLDQALGFGITTVEVKSGYGLDFKSEEKMLKVIQKMQTAHPIDVIPTFLVHTVPKEMQREKYIQQAAEEMIPAFRAYAEWFDVFLEKNVFSLKETGFLIQKAQNAGYHIGLHTNQVHDLGGVQLADEMGVRHVDHLEVLKSEDAKRIIGNKNLYPVFLPTAEAHVFSEHVGQIHQLLDIPDRLVLSSDFNPGSSPVLSPLAVINAALLRYRLSDPCLLLNTLTANPARMLFLDDRGVIQEGKKADFVGFQLDTFEQIPYFSTLDIIGFVMKDGKVFNRK